MFARRMSHLIGELRGVDQPKVEQADGAVGGDQDVVRLDVSMNETQFMHALATKKRKKVSMIKKKKQKLSHEYLASDITCSAKVSSAT